MNFKSALGKLRERGGGGRDGGGGGGRREERGEGVT